MLSKVDDLGIRWATKMSWTGSLRGLCPDPIIGRMVLPLQAAPVQRCAYGP
jgi:hypothetical protein